MELPGQSSEITGELRTLARNLSKLLNAASRIVEEDRDNEFARRLEAHLGSHPSSLNFSSTRFPPHQLVDIHLAFEAWAEEGSRQLEFVGYAG